MQGARDYLHARGPPPAGASRVKRPDRNSKDTVMAFPKRQRMHD